MSQKLNYEINETIKISPIEDKSEIDSILNNDSFFRDSIDGLNFEQFDNDNLIAQHMDYYENYNIKMLHHIANYYKIPKNRLKKDELIGLIIQFENDPENSELVYNRKRLWYYINELKDDKYFSKFIIFQ